jgi:peptidoglycan-associated lipoprotein
MKSALSLLFLSMFFLSGCATKTYVHEYVQSQLKPVAADVARLDGRANDADAARKAGELRLETSLAETRETVKAHAERIARNEADIAQLSGTAREAMARAEAAGMLAEGKLVYEVVMSNDQLKFATGSATLSADAKAALDEFANSLKEDNKNVFIEIQGHTDSRGEVDLNLRLGEARAEAVRRYLNMEAGIPLHRMAVISYGESAPVASNMNRAGREQNRRVVMVVIH